MRIIAGDYKGRKLLAPRTLRIRPTSDRVRESLFNILGPRFEGAHVLDLYAGVGTLGLEALSRGAERATFVDVFHQALQYLRKNSEFCRDKVDIIPADVHKVCDALAKRGKNFDVVFIDPPYQQGLIDPLLKKLDQKSLFRSDFVGVVQHSIREKFEETWNHFCVADKRIYGETQITFLESKQ